MLKILKGKKVSLRLDRSSGSMPELPEVETVKRALKKEIGNRIINDVYIYYDGIIEGISVDEFKNKIRGQRINDIERYGKWLMFAMDDYYMLSHLRMEGKYFIKNSNDDRNKHEHVIFKLDNDMELRYMDVRKFGKMHLIDKELVYDVSPLSLLGLEPWDKNLNSNYLMDKYKNKRLPIKSVILDQGIIVGIGNIYADEVLYLSGINPLKRAMDLTEEECNSIIKNTREILEKSINDGGTTIRSYGSVNGVHGNNQNNLLVHTKEGSKCLRCGNIIKKIKVGGRGTYYCDNCQK